MSGTFSFPFACIDLTHTLEPTIPTWDGSCGFCATMKSDYTSGCKTQDLVMNAGIGTHMDAPAHFVFGGADSASMAIELFVAPAYIIDVSRKAHADYMISVEDIVEFEKKFGKIAQKSIVLAHTGWSRYWKTPEVYRGQAQDGSLHFPSFSKNAAELILERNINGIGIDTLSPDSVDRTFPVHHLLLGNGKFIIENLTALERMPQVGGYVTVAPLKMKDLTESPIRAIGMY